jgi:ATP-binding cassette subfamily C (CFTR/MRP) protein 1
MLLSPVLTFAIFLAISNSRHETLDTARMFVSLSFLMLISQPLSSLFQSAPSIMSMVGCFDRVEKFIQTDQWTDPRHHDAAIPSQNSGSSEGKDHFDFITKNSGGDQTTPEFASEGSKITIENGTFRWGKETVSKPVLEGINLKIPRGKLTFVTGPVGCGKTTLLKAILGEIPPSAGAVHISPDSVAYCDQTPWVINGTIKENITMFSTSQDLFYRTVIRACALEDDLKQLPDGDMSKLGSKGITLSGGQKQRLVRLWLNWLILSHTNRVAIVFGACIICKT